jgi:CheY-like chemotaxis protein
MVLAAIEAALALRGACVVTASDGREAVRLAAELRPSLVLLDLNMPVMDGAGFAAEVRRLGMEMPIVLISGEENLDRWARSLGAVAYLRKPFPTQQLTSLVDKTLAAAS